MKKNIYECQKCGEKTITGNRDEGVTPMFLGCKVKECEGSARSMMFMVDQSIEPEFVFIKPRNENEWKAIRDQAKKDIIEMFPKKKPTKVEKMLVRLMSALTEHVSKGGIVELPKSVVDQLNL